MPPTINFKVSDKQYAFLQNLGRKQGLKPTTQARALMLLAAAKVAELYGRIGHEALQETPLEGDEKDLV